MNVCQKHRDSKNKGGEEEKFPHKRLLPEDKAHKEGHARMPREEEPCLEIVVKVDAIKNARSRYYLSWINTNVRKGDKKSPYGNKKRYGLETEEDIARFREDEKRRENDS